MSLIIDILNKKSKLHENRKSLFTPGEEEIRTQELLANTYLKSSSPERAGGTTRPKSPSPSKAPRFPARVSPGAVALLSAAIIGGGITFLAASDTFNVSVVITREAPAAYEDLLRGREIELAGGAFKEKGRIVLRSHRQSPPPAGLIINTPAGLDLSEKSLQITVAPIKGQSALRVVLRDKNYRSYISDTLLVSGEKDVRQNFAIMPDRPKESIDISAITHVRVEMAGPAGSGDEAGPSASVDVDKVLIIR